MDPKRIAKQTFDFYKSTFNNTFNAMTMLQEQTQKVMDMYLEGIRDARSISYIFFLLATGLVIWSATGFILASNADLKFGIGMVESVQYLAISAIVAILITVVGVNLSKRLAGESTIQSIK